MRWIESIVGIVRGIVREVFGLFVDDGSFALSILLWFGFVWLALPRLPIPSHWNGLILFSGLGLILIVSAIRYSRSRHAK